MPAASRTVIKKFAQTPRPRPVSGDWSAAILPRWFRKKKRNLSGTRIVACPDLNKSKRKKKSKTSEESPAWIRVVVGTKRPRRNAGSDFSAGKIPLCVSAQLPARKRGGRRSRSMPVS